MSASEYWNMTPHEFNTAMSVSNDLIETKFNMEKTISWLTAKMSRASKIPSLELITTGIDRPQYTDTELNKAREFHNKLVSR